MKYRTGDPKKKKKKAQVRGVDVDKLPEGRIKEYDTPFPFRKRKKK
jgi:hypothetical protein